MKKVSYMRDGKLVEADMPEGTVEASWTAPRSADLAGLLRDAAIAHNLVVEELRVRRGPFRQRVSVRVSGLVWSLECFEAGVRQALSDHTR